MSISDEELYQLNRSLQQLSGTVGAMSSKMTPDKGGRANANSVLKEDLSSKKSLIEKTNDVSKAMERGTRSVRESMNGIDELGRTASAVAKAIPGGFIVSELIHYLTNTTGVYKELSNVGQTFGGSMIQMSVAAGQAGLPLREFAQATKNNSQVVATLGQGFFNINKEVRRASEGMGLYGMTLDQLNDFSGGYLEQQRLTGALTRAGQTRQVKAINDLALSVSGIAVITGKAREQIMETTKAALTDPAVVAAMAGNVARGMHSYNDEITKAVSLLSAQAGEAGRMLSGGLAQTMAMGGAQFTKEANTMLEAGFGEGVLLLQQAADKLARGIDAETVNMELINSLKAATDNPATREALLNQARAGNEQAREILSATQNLKTFTRAEMEAAKASAKNKDLLTGIATAFESIFGSLKGSFVEGFLSPFTKGGRDFNKSLASIQEKFKPLGDTFKDFGQVWGEHVDKFLTGDNLAFFMNSVKEAAGSASLFIRSVFTRDNIALAVGMIRVIGEVAVLAGSIFTNVLFPPLKWLASGLTFINEKVTAFGEALGMTNAKKLGSYAVAAMVGLGAMLLLAIKKGISKLIAPTVRIDAGVVNVVGGGGIGRGGGGGRGRGRGGRGGFGAEERARRAKQAGGGKAQDKVSRARRAVAGGTPAAPRNRGGGGARHRAMRADARGIGGKVRRGTATAKAGAKVAGKGVGKSLLKKIPGVGLVSGLAMGAGRAMSGDFVGAGLEVASGAASMVPGLGTAASVGIDGLLLARDMGVIGGKKNGAAKPSGGKMRRIGGMVGLGVAGLGAAGAVGMAGHAVASNLARPMTQAEATIDTVYQAERLRAANPDDKTNSNMEQLLNEMRRLNQMTGEQHAVAVAQLENSVEAANAQRNTARAIEMGKR